ncbi:homoserine kinase [Virgibacillus sp. 179-BFC.A HS]|uniref:Homoserine kinase n=1 Tax=Tigheibacillus jepli TaxID=3035914 RepID=A0ABU5CLD0_9BACI|nr:homoserine kinase [Virgibacillus sp. 179-BFC.A HS]MDY0407030.1 homoserine kinase [Virgibacillus sp. 179-BFC.A HS]
MAFQIRVPASSANLGPGFDSVGIAFNRFLTLDVTPYDSWQFIHRSALLLDCPPYEEHLIYQIALKTAQNFHREMPPHQVAITSEIPFARGLGSSASAVLAGIELANQICELQLSDDDKLLLATEMEGHPDNVAAALFGGLVIAAQHAVGEKAEKLVDYVCIPTLKDVLAVLYIPQFELKTAAAREVLPKQLQRSQATTASAISNMMIASLLTGNYEQAGKWMEQDIFHEPYRAKLLPDYEQIKRDAKQLGAYGTVISGAGPTMLSLVPTGKAIQIVAEMRKRLPKYHVEPTPFNQSGMKVVSNVQVD